MRHSLKGITRIQVTSTASSLASLLAAGKGTTAIPESIDRLVLIPVSGGVVNWAMGQAPDATYPQIPIGGMDMPITSSDAANMQLFASTTTNLDICQICEI
jgi:hypothetical protein